MCWCAVKKLLCEVEHFTRSVWGICLWLKLHKYYSDVKIIKNKLPRFYSPPCICIYHWFVVWMINLSKHYYYCCYYYYYWACAQKLTGIQHSLPHKRCSCGPETSDKNIVFCCLSSCWCSSGAWRCVSSTSCSRWSASEASTSAVLQC